MKSLASASSNTTLEIIDEKCVTPNAIDIRLDRVFKLRDTRFTVTESEKVHRDRVELQPNEGSGMWHLDPGVYEAISENKITIGQGEAGFVITRSTLNRNGVFITSGLYDTGYHGNLAMVLHVTTGYMQIAPQTRIGQFLTFDAENLFDYDGDYGHGKAMEEALYGK